jgi:hypothetical protein
MGVSLMPWPLPNHNFSTRVKLRVVDINLEFIMVVDYNSKLYTMSY